jgi:predicted PurR-regulated permease PerM
MFLGSLPAVLESLQDQSSFLNEFLATYNLTSQYETWLSDMQSSIGSIASSIGGSFVDIISKLASALVSVIFVAIATFLMLVEGPTWEEKFWRLIYKDNKKRRRHQQLARKMYDVISGYVSGQALLAFMSATSSLILVAVLSLIFNFEISLIWPAWMFVFITSFIPLFGGLIGGGVVTILLLLFAWPAAVIYAVLFTIEQQIESNLVQPHIQSKRLKMSALLVLIAVLVGLQLAGVLGALVAIPVAGIIMVWLKDMMRRRRVSSAAEQGEAIDPDNDIDDVSVVFVEEKRKPIESLAKIGQKIKKKSKK